MMLHEAGGCQGGYQQALTQHIGDVQAVACGELAHRRHERIILHTAGRQLCIAELASWQHARGAPLHGDTPHVNASTNTAFEFEATFRTRRLTEKL